MDDIDPSSDDEKFPRSGLGGSTASARNISKLHSPSPSSSDSQFSSASEDLQDQKSGLSSSFGGARARVRKRRRAASRVSRQQSGTQKAADPGEWERHTRGIGSKILAKHGFTGRLGKRADGIAAPIQPVFRPEKLGLGAGGFSEKGEEVEVQEAIERHERETTVSKRQQGAANDAVLQDTFDKVIDMRDAFPREASSVAELLHSEQSAKDDPEKAVIKERLFATPEILYNLHMLTENARANVSSVKRRSETERFIIQSAERDIATAEAEKAETTQALAYIAELESLFDRLSATQESETANTFESCVKRLVTIRATLVENSIVDSTVFVAALTEVVTKRVEKCFQACLINSVEKGKADKKLGRQIYRILAAIQKGLDSVTYAKLCTRAILVPLRGHVAQPSWDVVRGACVGDILSFLRPILPEAMLRIFGEDVLVPRLLSRLRSYHSSSLIQTGEGVPAHIWIHPWLPATGRRPLVEVIHHIRITLSKTLQGWKPGGSDESRTALVTIVKSWTGVLSQRKLQLAISRHITSKLGKSLTSATRSTPDVTKQLLDDIVAWSDVGSVRLLAKEIMEPFISGPGAALRNRAFADEGWIKGRELYLSWTRHLPKRLKECMQPALAALLFVLHAARVTTDPSLRRRLQQADLGPLLQNFFQRPLIADRQKKSPQHEFIERRGERRKARLADVLEIVGKREGLAVVGIGEERGMRVFQVGVARVIIDVERNVFVIGGQVVDVDEMIRLAKGQ